VLGGGFSEGGGSGNGGLDVILANHVLSLDNNLQWLSMGIGNHGYHQLY